MNRKSTKLKLIRLYNQLILIKHLITAMRSLSLCNIQEKSKFNTHQQQ